MGPWGSAQHDFDGLATAHDGDIGWHLHLHQPLARTEGGQNVFTAESAVWPHDNKAALCRLVGGPGDNAAYIENRSGDPAANPYLFMATQIFAGLDGMANQTDPGGPLNDGPS